MELYILQTIFYQSIFLFFYDVFLKKETFFNCNRAYLLLTSIMSFALPLIKLKSFGNIIAPNFTIPLPEVIIGVSDVNNHVVKISEIEVLETAQSFQWQWTYLFWFGLALSAFILVYKLLKIYFLINNNKRFWNNNILIVKLENSTTAFSFFHFVFIGDRISEEAKDVILKHEKVHVIQKHTLDLLYFEVLRVLFWFNPLLYFYQSRLISLHEFIADREVLQSKERVVYYQSLLSQVFDTQSVSFINTFYRKSLIKKRIVMLSKSKSKKHLVLKYLLVVPLISMILVFTSACTQETNKPVETYQELSDEVLKQRLYDELLDLEAQEIDFTEISSLYMKPEYDNYIKSRENYYRLSVYIKRMLEKANNQKELNTDYNTLISKDMLNILDRTYDEYLSYKKTKEAKEKWEGQSRNGFLNLAFDDLKNMSESDKEKMNEAIETIKNDHYLHTLIMTDGITTTKMIIEKNMIENIYDSNIEVPFAVIDEIPIYKDCESFTTNETRRKCMSQKITNVFAENFNTKLGEELGLKGNQRINLIFKIDQQGKVKDARVRAPHPDLEAEALRVINLLPQMKPGMHNGQTVVVPYSLPILFKVNE
jgi:bla regulator protein BlaR1